MKMVKRMDVVFLYVLILCLTLGNLGCGGDGSFNPFLSSDGTGVRGLDTPEEILSNPYVEDILNEARDEGLDITPEHGINPPVISGTYDLNGTLYVPLHGPLAPGTWQWSNQTSDNHINTDYDQGFQSGSNVEGEIIRGTDNRFTVYSVLDITNNGYVDRAIALIDGEQDNQGNIDAIYIVTPIESGAYIVPSAGYMELTLNGLAKTSVKKGGGTYLISQIKDALEKSMK